MRPLRTVGARNNIKYNILLYSDGINFLRVKREIPLLDHCVLVLGAFHYPLRRKRVVC